jgi:hypothetical protein
MGTEDTIAYPFMPVPGRIIAYLSVIINEPFVVSSILSWISCAWSGILLLLSAQNVPDTLRGPTSCI